MAKKNIDEELKHVHTWKLSFSGSEMKCICGHVLISRKEEERRKAEWDNYFELIKTTAAYQDYLEMRQAFKAGDKVKMAEILQWVSKRCWVNPDYQGMIGEEKYQFNEEAYLPKPSFPDPGTWNKYVIS